MRVRSAIGVISALVLIGASVVPASATMGSTASARGGTAHVAVPAPVPDTTTAQTLAYETGEPVVVDDMTTPTELTSALPDGTLQYEVSSVPVRVEQNDSWVPVDLALEQRDAWFEPAASAMPVRFSSGGTDALAQVFTSGEWVSEVWPHGDLPAPSIDGDTATYSEVLPGVDLKLVATSTGMASIYVVKSEKAALSSGLADLHVLIEGAELKETASGTAVAETSNGAQLHSGQPLWWDSSEGGTYREPGGEVPVIPVTHDVESDRVSMDVGDSVERHERRSDSDVTYPIFVDPDWSSGISASWYTDAAYPNQSYLSAGASDVLRVGIYGNYRSDMFLQFPLSAIAGKVVSSARLNTTQLSVESSGAGAIQVHTYGIKPAGFTWAQEQAWNAAGTGGWSGILQAPWYGPGYGSPAMAVGWDVTSGVKAKVGQSAIQFAFTYSSPTLPSRRHYSRAATLIVTYNSLPNTPTAPVMTSPSRACGTAAAPASLGASDVTVRVNQTDPDPGNVDTNFYLATAANLSTVLQSRAGGLGAQGAKAATFTGLANGQTYAWRARGSDWKNDGASYSAWCYFKVDLTKPAVPGVSAAPGATFTVSEVLSVAVTGAADVAGYVYWVTPVQTVSPAPPVPVSGTVSKIGALPPCAGVVSTEVRWACGNGTSAVSITAAPTDSLSTLWVSAYDKAGNQSAAAGLPLYSNGDAATPALPANLDAGHAWQVSAMASPLPNTVPDSNPWIGANAIDLIIPETSSTTSTDLPDPPISSPVISTAGGTADEVHTWTAPVDATNSFSFSTWVKTSYIPSATQKIMLQGFGSAGTVQLQLTGAGKYAFCVGFYSVTSSSTTPESNCATGGVATPNQWQLVTGVWDAGNQQLRLLVGNDITPVASIGHVVGTGDWTASGPVIFGPAPMTGRFEGLIANPAFVPDVIDHNQLAQLAGFMLPFSE